MMSLKQSVYNTMYVFMVYNMLFFNIKVPNQFHFTCLYKTAAYILCILLGIFCTQFACIQLKKLGICAEYAQQQIIYFLHM